ncbi:DUF3299 domain-containing protein [Lutimaribacter marinistellae]|uniref:DUF3299 domain-containing protein n=1 Tax=Lutimaribacter marinistellae TaxID=1820329 RepID=A0ABV7TKH0_9RHOB
MQHQTRFWHGVLFAALTLMLLGALLPQGARAAPQFATWQELVPEVAPYDDPFIEMTFGQRSDLRDVLRYQQSLEIGEATDEMRELAESARDRLSVYGLDPEKLLQQRLVVMERRRAAATSVSTALVDREILMDGYVLPLEWDGENVVEFLLVPWVGACIHTPPPPPNQIIHVNYPQGLAVEQRFEPVRLQGTLRHSPAAHDLFLIDGSQAVMASYGLDAAQITGIPGNLTEVTYSDPNLSWIARMQVWVSSLFTSSMSALGRGDGFSIATFFALLLSLGYGFLHTLGPGHGKTVVISYFVGEGGNLGRGMLMGARIAVVHVFSAVICVVAFDLTVRQLTGAAPADYRMVRLASYATIMAIGTVMLWRAVAAWRSTRTVEGGHHHHHDHHAGCSACAAAAARGRRSEGWLALAVGVVPCTGALIVMLYGLANDLIVPAVIMVCAISLGMAIAMSALGVAALWGRAQVERRIGDDAQRLTGFQNGARLVGATLVLTVGIILFTSTLTQDSAGRLAVGESSSQFEAAGVSLRP